MSVSVDDESMKALVEGRPGDESKVQLGCDEDFVTGKTCTTCHLATTYAHAVTKRADAE